MSLPHGAGVGDAALVSVAGFRPDLRAGLARHGLAVTLGDEISFTEFFPAAALPGFGVDDLLLTVPAAAELLGLDPVPEVRTTPLDGLPAAVRAVVLDPAAVRILAGIDDTRLRKLWTGWWSLLAARRPDPDRDDLPTPDLTQAIRGLVVQARAAVANGWVVVLAARG